MNKTSFSLAVGQRVLSIYMYVIGSAKLWMQTGYLLEKRELLREKAEEFHEHSM